MPWDECQCWWKGVLAGEVQADEMLDGSALGGQQRCAVRVE